MRVNHFAVITLNGESNVIQERVVGNGVIHIVDGVLSPGEGGIRFGIVCIISLRGD